MESIIHDVTTRTRAGDEFNLSVYGDLHEDAEACDLAGIT